MQRVYFLFWKYEPTTATFQRRWALAKGVAENGVSVTSIFLLPSCGERMHVSPHNMECLFWGDDFKLGSKIICLLYNTFKVLRVLKRNDILFGLTFFPVMLLTQIFCPKGVRRYVEYTEYPPLMHKGKFLGKLSLRYFLSYIKGLSGTFVISNKIKEYFISEGVDQSKIHIINMIVDTKRFENIEKQSSDNYICYCGTVSNYKDGANILLEAFGLISNKYPDLKLYILGNTPKEADRILNNSIISKYKIHDKVFMPGKVAGDKMPQFLKNASILALARPNNIQAAYGFPTKLGEYLMTGNPVVVTKVGELDSFLQDKESCVFVEPNNPQDFADKLEWVLLHENQAKIIGKKGCEIAEKSFNYLIESQKIVNTIIL